MSYVFGPVKPERYCFFSEALVAHVEYIELLEADIVIYEERLGNLRESLGASKVNLVTMGSLMGNREIVLEMGCVQIKKRYFVEKL